MWLNDLVLLSFLFLRRFTLAAPLPRPITDGWLSFNVAVRNRRPMVADRPPFLPRLAANHPPFLLRLAAQLSSGTAQLLSDIAIVHKSPLPWLQIYEHKIHGCRSVSARTTCCYGGCSYQ